MHHHFAADPDEQRERRWRRSEYPLVSFNPAVFHVVSSFPRKLVVNVLQTLAQMKHRVALTRQQRVDANACLRRQRLEAAALELMSDKDFALLGRQFVERGIQLIQKHIAQAERFRSYIGRGQKIFDLQQLAVFVLERGVGKTYRLLLAEEVCDAIARYAKKPAGHVVDRHQQAIGFHQFVEDLLQKIFDVGRSEESR